MFWRLELATVWRLNQVAKNACLAETGAVFKSFSVFPRTFVTVHLLSKISPFQTLQTLRESIFQTSLVPHFLSKSSRKGMGFAFSISFSLFLDIFATVWIDIVFEILLSMCNGYGVFCLLLFSSVFMLSGHNVFFHYSNICLLLSLKIFS